MPAPAKKRKLSLSEARLTADTIMRFLRPRCIEGKCRVAGSVRRGRPYVNDIEIVCLPKMEVAPTAGELFAKEQNMVINWLQHEERKDHGLNIMKGGPRYYRIAYGFDMVDIFMPVPDQWGRILALRTGPVEFSVKMAGRWVEMGYHGIDGRLVSKENGLEPVFATEKGFFEFLKWNYVAPEQRHREYTNYYPARPNRKQTR